MSHYHRDSLSMTILAGRGAKRYVAICSDWHRSAVARWLNSTWKKVEVIHLRKAVL